MRSVFVVKLINSLEFLNNQPPTRSDERLGWPSEKSEAGTHESGTLDRQLLLRLRLHVHRE